MTEPVQEAPPEPSADSIEYDTLTEHQKQCIAMDKAAQLEAAALYANIAGVPPGSIFGADVEYVEDAPNWKSWEERSRKYPSSPPHPDDSPELAAAKTEYQLQRRIDQVMELGQRIEHLEMLIRYGSKRAIKEEREAMVQRNAWTTVREQKDDTEKAGGILAGGGDDGGGILGRRR